MNELRLHKIMKQYGDHVVVENINLDIQKGEMISLLGPSGCGKTTTLRMIAGLLEPSGGSIELGGMNLTHVPTYQRKIGMVFQNYALFPHLSIFENVAFGLRRQKTPKVEIKERVSRALQSVHLDGYEKRLPSQLSGGQQQRVALARALVLKPTLILFDEPLSNLDAKLRNILRVEIRQLQREHGFTGIFVTHDQEEAMVLSDRIAVMNQGKIVQLDTPEQVYRNPRDPFVADFVGDSNLLSIQDSYKKDQEWVITLVGGQQIRANATESVKAPTTAMIRPEAIMIESALSGEEKAQHDSSNYLSGQVEFIHYLGAEYLTGLKVKGYDKTFLIRCSSQLDTSSSIKEGNKVIVRWAIASTLVF